MAPLLEVEDVSLRFGGAVILSDVTISLDASGCTGLFGPNGHGKTSLLEAISGLHRLHSGHIRFDGEEITHLSPRAIVDRGVIHVPQGNTLYPRMTVLENLWLGSYPPRAWRRRRQRLADVFALFPRLGERRTQLCRTLSGGERQMLAIGVGLMSNGRVLMLDEPTQGLSPKARGELRDAVKKLVDAGTPLLLVEQDMEFLQSLARRLYLVQKGRATLATNASEANLDRAEILRTYFGVGSERPDDVLVHEAGGEAE